MRPISLLTILVFAGFCAFPTMSHAEFRPVSELPATTCAVINPVSTVVDFSTSITPPDGESGSFVESMAGLLRLFPCPVVCWSHPSVQLRELVEIPDDGESSFVEYSPAHWQDGTRTDEVEATGPVGTPTGEELSQSIQRDLDELRERLVANISESEQQSPTDEETLSTVSEHDDDAWNKTWKDVFESIERVSSDYRVIQRDGFTEIVWGATDAVNTIRKNMATEVPPIAFTAEKPTQFLSMWRAVSGMEFEYETSLATNLEPANDLKEDFPESVSPNWFCMEEDEEEDEYRASEILTVTRTLPVAEFMDTLALTLGGSAWCENGMWRVGQFRQDEEGIRLILDLLKELKESPYDHGYGSAERRLKRIGLPALPEVLKEFEVAESYYYNSLAVVLSTMDSPERDAAFLSKLRLGAATGDQFLENWFGSTMMYTLARRGCKEVIPLIRQYALQDRRSATDARVCLNLLDAPLPSSDPASLLVTEGTGQAESQDPDLSEVVEVLYAALDQCWDSSRPLRLSEIEREKDGVISFTGSFGERGGTWMMRVGQPIRDKVAVYFTWYTGPLAAAGYEGRAEKRNGRWLFVRWWQSWIS